MEVKDNREISTAQIKRLAAYKSAPVNSDRDASVRVSCKNKSRAGVLPPQNWKYKNTPKYCGTQRYCVMCKK